MNPDKFNMQSHHHYIENFPIGLKFMPSCKVQPYFIARDGCHESGHMEKIIIQDYHLIIEWPHASTQGRYFSCVSG